MPNATGVRAAPHALAISLGAFLLFTLQLIVAKAITPWYGGTPAVWTTCLVFFQTLLTLGYAYAHGAVRGLSPRGQSAAHIALVIVAGAALGGCALAWGQPLIADDRWKPDGGVHPVGAILILLTTATAIPGLVLAATSPLVQAWFSRTFPERAVTRLYALSNAGSLLALIAYPLLIEPWLDLRSQALAWSALFAVYGVTVALCASTASRSTNTSAAPSHVTSSPTWRTRAFWLTCGACGSMLLVAVSNLISQEMSTSPLLWSLPLAVYLTTFIICFDRDDVYRRTPFSWLQAGSMLITLWLLEEATAHDPRLTVAGALATLFVGCMICHGELVRSRPTAEHLTAFYLTLSVGGALGGAMVSLGAPLLFTGLWEMQLGTLLVALLLALALLLDRGSWVHQAQLATPAMLLMAALIAAFGGYGLRTQPDLRPALATWLGGIFGGTALCAVVVLWVSTQRRLGLHQRRRQGVLIALSLLISTFAASLWLTANPFAWARVTYARRNFYGMVRVLELDNLRVLAHGSTFHGWQRKDAPQVTTSYYAPGTGLDTTLRAVQALHPRVRVAAVGLGTGQIAAYLRPEDRATFYEIDDHIIDVAAGPRPLFTYVRDSRGQVTTVAGDGRLSLEREQTRFDVVVLDAFSSDTIPLHLLTREAFDVYARRLEPDGVIAVHISNRYFDLAPQVRRQLTDLGMTPALLYAPSRDEAHTPAQWVVGSRDATFTARPDVRAATTAPGSGAALPTPWTDRFSNMWSALRN